MAQQELETAERLLSRCSGGDSSGAAQVQSGAARQLMQRLQAAYADMWQLQLREGLHELLVSAAPSGSSILQNLRYSHCRDQ